MACSERMHTQPNCVAGGVRQSSYQTIDKPEVPRNLGMQIQRSIDAKGTASLKSIKVAPKLGGYEIVDVQPRVIDRFNEVRRRQHCRQTVTECKSRNL